MLPLGRGRTGRDDMSSLRQCDHGRTRWDSPDGFPVVFAIFQRLPGQEIEVPHFALCLAVFFEVFVEVLLRGNGIDLPEEVTLDSIETARCSPRRRCKSWRCRRLMHSSHHWIVHLRSHGDGDFLLGKQSTKAHLLTHKTAFECFSWRMFLMPSFCLYTKYFFSVLPAFTSKTYAVCIPRLTVCGVITTRLTVIVVMLVTLRKCCPSRCYRTTQSLTKKLSRYRKLSVRDRQQQLRD